MAVSGKEPSVAPVLLGRMSSLSPEVLSELLARDSIALMNKIENLEEQMELLRPELEDALYASVPKLDKKKRRAALSLRRDIHNGRSPKQPEQFFEPLLEELEDGLGRRVGQWLEHAYEARELNHAAEKAFAAELQKAESDLIPLLRQEEVLKGLAFASPDFTRTIAGTRAPRSAPAETQLGRACISFAARAATKLSPFSTLTTLEQTSFSNGENEDLATDTDARGSGSPGHSVFLLSKAIATSALRACSFDDELKHAFSYRTTDAMRSVNGRPLGLQPDYKVIDGRFFRSDTVMDMRAYAKQFNVLEGSSTKSYEEWLDQLGGASPHITFERLLTGNMIRPVAPWKIGDPWPLEALINLLRGISSDRASAAVEILQEVDSITRSLAHMDARKRLEALEQIVEVAQGFFRLFGGALPSWLRTKDDGRKLVYEDAKAPAALPCLPESVRDDLKMLARWMRPFTVRTAAYDMLLDFFIQNYGPGGKADDLLSFLLEFSSQPGLEMKLYPLLTAPHDPDAWKKAVGPSSTPPSYMVFFQVVARDEAALHRGDYQLVLNQVNNGLGGLITRFDPLLSGRPGRRGLASTIMEWIETLFPGASPMHIPVSADWNGLQNKGLERFPFLQWPGEWPTADGGEGVSLRDLTLVHHETDNTLVILGPDGRPAAPIYMGVVPHELTMGPLRHFFALLIPWENRADLTWRPSLWRRRTRLGEDDIEQAPRQTVGRIVTKRAAWRLHPRRFPQKNPGETAYEYMGRVNRWRKAIGIPKEVFFRGEPLGRVFSTNKPAWLHFYNLHSILNAAHTIQSGAEQFGAVIFEEALPALKDHWFAPEQQVFATEFVGLVAWPHGEPSIEFREFPAQTRRDDGKNGIG